MSNWPEPLSGKYGMSVPARAVSWLGATRVVPAALTSLWVLWSLVLGTGEKQRVVGMTAEASEPVEHVVTFLLLGALLMMTVRRRPLVVFVALVAAGFVGELLQLGVAGRTFSLDDLSMDAIGAAVGVAAARRSIPWTRIVTYAITVVLIATTPALLTDSETPPITVFPEDCAPPPLPSDRDPEIILQVEGLDEAELPRVVDRPGVNVIRHRLMQTDELTVETWFETSNLAQDGPARVFTISRGSATTRLNLHIGVVDDGLSIRLRNSCDIFNRIQVDGVLQADRAHHVVFTWAGGVITTWVDGQVVGREELPWGDFRRWNVNYDIVIGAETGGGHAFDGTIYSVTMWDGALPDDQIVDRSNLVPVDLD